MTEGLLFVLTFAMFVEDGLLLRLRFLRAVDGKGSRLLLPVASAASCGDVDDADEEEGEERAPADEGGE